MNLTGERELKNHTCTVSMCLYGGGDHIIDISPGTVKGKKYHKVIKRVCMCRVCGQCYKMVQAFDGSGVKEMMKPITPQEHMKYVSEKFHKISEMKPDKETNDEIEAARKPDGEE